MGEDDDPAAPPEGEQASADTPVAAGSGSGPGYAVGYRRPPKEHQIKPGERRNPHGRPKGSKNVKTIVRQEHGRLVAFHDGKTKQRKPALELMIRGDVSDALNRNEKSRARQIALALRIAEEDEAKAAAKKQRDTFAEDAAILARYLNPDAKPEESEEDK